MPVEKKPQYKVGDRIQISLNNRILDATIRAIIQQTDGVRYQVGFGNELTALGLRVAGSKGKMSVRIVRVNPKPGGQEEPWLYRGYKLADPRLGTKHHHEENAVCVPTLEKAADLIEQKGFSIRMGRKGFDPP